MNVYKRMLVSAVVGSAAALTASTASAALGSLSDVISHEFDGAMSGPQLVDARDYRHCHNMPRRTYCHKGERLPRNWPPNSNTPGSTRKPCWVDKRSCVFGALHSR